MSQRSLVVHQAALSDIEAAMTSATGSIGSHVTGLLDAVNAQTGAWTPETGSRIAQAEHDRRLREGVARLTEALDRVRAAVATYREDAREAEVENVAIVG